ncbi:hypothetical protein JAAARDRAFT_472372 [Jaapia argillacea MUCL 33604]|uniref:Uncharacterized protein n=1 Tax=Jaapia argillacea MUCL 33604 TaxID=933084 RepID=A0A067PCZ9_9AGAM|nr:hypothetical protein JAAARDRAFT_472372 [Jaapia argillacea MUCL 33604]
MVTEDETSDAMSSVRFRWTRRIMKPINSFINTMVRPPKIIRPVRSFRSAGDGSFHGADEELMSAGAVGRNGLGLSSVVNVGLNGPRQRVKSASGGAKKKLGIRTGTFRNGNASGSNVTGGGVPRSKSIDRLPPMPKHHGSIGGSTPKARRGSETLLAPPSRPCIGGAVTPYSVSPTSSTIADEHVFFGTEKNLHHPPEEKSSGGGKNRFSLSAWKPWKPSRPTSLGPLPHEVSTTSSTPAPVMRHFGGRPVQDFYARRSEEAFSGSVSAGPSRVSSMDKDKGILTATMRASSWGETAEYARQSEDITSIHSGDRWDDAVDDEVMHLGAGGVSDDPNLPSFHISAASSSLRMGGAKPTPLPLLQPQPERFFDEPGGSLPLIADPAMQDIVRQGSRSHAMSPLAQVSYYPDRPEDDYDEDDDDDSSFFDRASEYETNRRNNTSQMYDDEDIEDEDDDDDESDEAVPLEVRRRRPSVSVTVTSPPSSSEIERN